MNSTNLEIGLRIKKLRKQAGLTQAELGEKIGYSCKHVSELERGITGISIDLQILLSNFFHCSIDYLLTGKEMSSVDHLLPDTILEILHSENQKEIKLLRSYLDLYSKIHIIQD